MRLQSFFHHAPAARIAILCIVVLAGAVLSGCSSVPRVDTGSRGILQQDAGLASVPVAKPDLALTHKVGNSEYGYIWPVKNAEISSPFGERALKFKRKRRSRGVARVRFHEGIDIKAFRGSPVFAAKDGVVIYSSRKIKGYGNMVVVKHDDGMATVYAHNKNNIVKRGDRVAQGEVIAYVGATGKATGVHLHFEVRKGELPEDPIMYLPPLHGDAVAQKELDKRVN